MNDRLTLMSYNIHGSVGADGKTNPPRIAAVIDSIGADVIALQEVGADRLVDQLDFISKALQMTAIAGPTLYRDGGRYGNALLTRLRVVRYVQHDLSVGHLERRGAIDAILLTPQWGPIRVVTTHLGLRRHERWLQRAKLAPVLEDGDRHQPLIVMGDFNQLWPPFGELDRRWPNVRNGRMVRSYPAWCPLLPLDRILVRPVSLVREVQSVRTALTRSASDHLPVRAVLSPRAAAGVVGQSGATG